MNSSPLVGGGLGLLSKHMNGLVLALQHDFSSVGGDDWGQSVHVVFAVNDGAAHITLGPALPVLKGGLHQIA